MKYPHMKTEVKEVTQVEYITWICNRCGVKFEDNNHDDRAEIAEFLEINTTGGYGSVFGDQNHIKCDICQHCLLEMIGPFCEISDNMKPAKMAKGRFQVGDLVARVEYFHPAPPNKIDYLFICVPKQPLGRVTKVHPNDLSVDVLWEGVQNARFVWSHLLMDPIKRNDNMIALCEICELPIEEGSEYIYHEKDHLHMACIEQEAVDRGQMTNEVYREMDSIQAENKTYHTRCLPYEPIK